MIVSRLEQRRTDDGAALNLFT